MKPSKLDSIPPITLTFERERCPYHAKQLEDASKSEAERREQGERGSSMVKRQQPQHIMRPPQAMATGPDRAAFNQQWNRECRQAHVRAPAKNRDTLKAEFKAKREERCPLPRTKQRER